MSANMDQTLALAHRLSAMAAQELEDIRAFGLQAKELIKQNPDAQMPVQEYFNNLKWLHQKQMDLLQIQEQFMIVARQAKEDLTDMEENLDDVQAFIDRRLAEERDNLVPMLIRESSYYAEDVDDLAQRYRDEGKDAVMRELTDKMRRTLQEAEQRYQELEWEADANQE